MYWEIAPRPTNKDIGCKRSPMSKLNNYLFSCTSILIVIISIVGCGLSTTSINQPITDIESEFNSLFGVASAGAALGGLVTLRATSSNGIEISTTVNADGFFEFSGVFK